MNLRVERRWRKATYTIGILYIDGVRFCETLEDTDRGLTDEMSVSTIKTRKIYGETAIPLGTYPVVMNVRSPKYSAVKFYKELCDGKMPRVTGVKGFEGILIHPGNSALDTLGCLLVGRNTVVGGLTKSRDTFKALYEKMSEAFKRGESIYITYTW